MKSYNTYDEIENGAYTPYSEQTGLETGLNETVEDPVTYTINDSFQNEAGHEAQNLTTDKNPMLRH